MKLLMRSSLALAAAFGPSVCLAAQKLIHGTLFD